MLFITVVLPVIVSIFVLWVAFHSCDNYFLSVYLALLFEEWQNQSLFAAAPDQYLPYLLMIIALITPSNVFGARNGTFMMFWI